MKTHKQQGSPAPCSDCENGSHNAPQIWPENEEAWELWQHVLTQWRAGGFGLVGLDYRAVEFVAGVIDIPVTKQVLKKIQALERFELSRANEKPDRGSK